MDLVKEAQKKRLLNIRKKKALHGWFTEDFCGTNKYYSQFDIDGYVIVSCVTQDKVNPFPERLNVEYVGKLNEYKGDVIRSPSTDNVLLYSLCEITHNGSHDF